MTEQSGSGQAAPAPALSEAAKAILEKAGVRQEQPNAAPAGEESPSEMTVDLGGGIKRAIKVSELVEAYNSKQALTQAEQVLNQKLAKMGDMQALNAMHDRIQQLNPARRQRLFELLQGDDEPDDADEEPDVDALADEALASGQRPRRQAQPGVDPAKFAQLEQAVMMLAGMANKNIQAENAKTTADKVTALMGSYEVFKEPGDAATSLARDTILMQAAANPKADLEELVKAVAHKVHTIQQARDQQVFNTLGIPTQQASLKIQPPKSGLNRHSLANGDMRRSLMDALRNGR